MSERVGDYMTTPDLDPDEPGISERERDSRILWRRARNLTFDQVREYIARGERRRREQPMPYLAFMCGVELP